MDIDGNGKDDRELIRRLVTLNNGTIDAEDVDGEVKGQITNHTRYIVRGDDTRAAGEPMTPRRADKCLLAVDASGQ